MPNIQDLYTQWAGQEPAAYDLLAKAGSNRKYARLTAHDGSTVIGVDGPSLSENACFVYLSRHFAGKGLPVPRILAESTDGHCYLQEDLGTLSLYDALASARQRGYHYDEADRQLLSRTIRLLAHVQVKGGEGLDYSRCLSPVRFDAKAAMFDLNYFKYSFFKPQDIPFDEVRLEADLERLAQDLAGAGNEDHHFLYRDFQARNVMLRREADGTLTPCFIDYQGGMEGPLHYDVASFLWQASARYSDELRGWLIGQYIDELRKLLPEVNEEQFRQRLLLFVMFRTLQVLGAYGLRGYVERKPYFLKSIPLAVANLRSLLEKGLCQPYPYLDELLRTLCAQPQFENHPATLAAPSTAGSAEQAQKPALVVRVFSFSYKKGIPADESGNGGGYVFDCRSTHNPGRYEPYKKLTGLDAPVIKFLEDDGEILTFLESVYRLADAHVERYIQRGFTDLMFSFGCTGGQHRSVYSAEHLACYLHEKYGITVRLQHREQGISRTLG